MHISIYTTGGTIDKVYFDAKSDYKIGAPQINEILQESNVTFTYQTTQIFSKDSLDITEEDKSVDCSDRCSRSLLSHSDHPWYRHHGGNSESPSIDTR